jgi:8-oxo-dGTP pyrophosphatase MutT (NUDIX family)
MGVRCLNCGINGHTTKVCNYPVTSYGLVCFKKVGNNLKYVMIQKKDSLSYTEFLRGKYDINNVTYLLKLFSKMTSEEKTLINSLSFSELWGKLWIKDSKDSKFQKDFNKNLYKFNKMKEGFKIKREDDTIVYLNIDYLVKNTLFTFSQEWEFAKGRRKHNESDIQCAIREFREETGIYDKVMIMDNYRQYEEIFQGSNNIRYRNIYYLANFVGDITTVTFDSNNIQQLKEVRDVDWFNFEEVYERIALNSTPEKIELFKRINSLINKNYLI